jgi:hypothetical protein
MTHFHPQQRFTPAALDVAFAPHCCRSDAGALRSQIDALQTFITARAQTGPPY